MARSKDILAHLGVRPSKGLGQNFTIDNRLIDEIIEFGKPQSSDTLVEIGPGLGALTERLSVFPKLTVIEIDEKLADALHLRFPNIDILEGDVRAVDFSEIGENLTVFGNLPYSFSTDIVFHLIANAASITRAVILLQREFAERVAAPPGGRDYGVLSISAQLWADMRLGPIFPGTMFHPPTKVQSRLLELTFLKEPRFKIDDMLHFQMVVKAAFSQRRRKLLNSLKGTALFPVEKLPAALAAVGIDGGRRAETLSIAEFVELAKVLRG